jgi:hypothetical protein
MQAKQLPLAGEQGSFFRLTSSLIGKLTNIPIERNALYAIREWAAPYDPALVYGGGYGDDVLARALDRLFEADRASLLTRVVLHAVKTDAVDLGQIHQDTTSVKLAGAYVNQRPSAVQLARGYSKDHRPDLKQLVYELSVTHDGAVPVLFKAHDGNRTETPCTRRTGRHCAAFWAAWTSSTWPTPSCASARR